MTKNRRSYHQHCGLARALDVLGERWTLLIVRDLLLGPRRYGEILGGLPGLTTNLLAKRLHFLCAEAIVEQVELPAPASATVYQLTGKGQELEPVIMEIGRWGQRHYLGHTLPRGDRADPAWALLALKRRYRGGASLRLHLDVGERLFAMHLQPDYVELRRGHPFEAALRAKGSFATWRALLYGGVPSSRLEKKGALRVVDRQECWPEFLRAFGLETAG